MVADTLWGPPRQRRGQAESLLQKTMRQWNGEGHLAGDRHASLRGSLRDLARAVDGARQDAQDGQISWYQAARTFELYRLALVAADDRTTHDDHDPIDELIANLRGPALRD